jgi:superoxide dismutase
MPVRAGFAWLTYNATSKMLAVESTPNQDNPIMKGYGYSGNAPLLGLDVVRVFSRLLHNDTT